MIAEKLVLVLVLVNETFSISVNCSLREQTYFRLSLLSNKSRKNRMPSQAK